MGRGLWGTRRDLVAGLSGVGVWSDRLTMNGDWFSADEGRRRREGPGAACEGATSEA